MSNTEVSESANSRKIADEASRRRTIAVISHPDAGKSTLTEALLLHAHAIGQAGAVHGKSGRRATVSDWMAMEQARGISISSAALQFEHRGTIINLVDTPGHADFSEDTYRVLASVDAAIMLVDAAKGLETQTMKLFEVCRLRGIPLITMINKWDRPGLDALALMDEIQDRTGLLPTPITWPVGLSGDFQGLVDAASGDLLRFTRTPGGATIAIEEPISGDAAVEAGGTAFATATEELDLLRMEGQTHEEALFLDGATTPVYFGAAVMNIGVRHLLDAIVDYAPAAEGRVDVKGNTRPVTSAFSGFVFKVQSGMNSAHRDRIAFIRVCSGEFQRGMTLTHEPTGRPFSTKYAQQLFGRERETVDNAWPGDVVGLVNALALRPGDTLFEGPAVSFPRMPAFEPEHFRVARSTESGKNKQFRKGIEQLDHEGVIQVLRSERRGEQYPILGAVGPLQFEVAAERMKEDFNAPIALDMLEYTIARETDAATALALAREQGSEIVSRTNGDLIALFNSPWRLKAINRDHPEYTLKSLGA
jgi:peptide chain release factor 3